jgi:molybdopterin molybdotransferase
MDGYAVISGDADKRQVVGSAPAGHPWGGTLSNGQALRIFTGSIIPRGADAVIIQEEVTRRSDVIQGPAVIRAGQHIRRAGQDFRLGDVLVPAGDRLTPRHIGLIAAGNHAWVSVHRHPVIAILATGDEIALPGDPLGPGRIVSSNAHALAALVRACGGVPLVLPIAADDPAAIAVAVASADHADMLVTTGGASVGDHDLIASTLQGMGMELVFWTIAMRPGKPLMHGHIGLLPVLGVPGNPVSAYVCSVLFLKPAIERLCGLPGILPPPVSGILTAALPANDHRADHLRCTINRGPDGNLLVTAANRQDSSLLRILAGAAGLILRSPHAPEAAAGSRVEVLPLDAMSL